MKLYVTSGFTGMTGNELARRLLNTAKIRSRTNWTPKVTLEEGIEMCIKELDSRWF